jgi:DNA polymerase delta subunit 1
MGAPHHTHYPTDLKEVPVLRMYGVTEAGNSVAAFVHGFEPYFYVEAPTPSFSPDDCQALAAELNVSGAAQLPCCSVDECFWQRLRRSSMNAWFCGSMGS